MTILALGNTIGDIMANLALAKFGMGLTGYTACFGGPLFNLLIGMGGSFFKASLKTGGFAFDIFGASGGDGDVGDLIVFGVMCSVILVTGLNAAFAVGMEYKLKGIYGKAMIGVYFVIVLLATIYIVLSKI